MIKVCGIFVCSPEEGECEFEDIRILDILENEGVGDLECGEIEECLNGSFEDYKDYNEGEYYSFQLKRVWDLDEYSEPCGFHFKILTKEQMVFEHADDCKCLDCFVITGNKMDVYPNTPFECECDVCLFECKEDKKKEVSDAH